MRDEWLVQRDLCIWSRDGQSFDKLRAGLTTKGSLTFNCNDAAHVHAATAAGSNSYVYDQDGNMTQRVVGGQTYNLGYDAEGHLVSVNGPSLSASFVYDGDGARVKSSINGVATTFVGNTYEVSGSTVTKYYSAGGQRVAMRQGSTLYYLLTDHPSTALRAGLGSTSITTNSTGTKVAELRYKACPLRFTPGVLREGEVRYTSGATPTKRQYSDQYSQVQFGRGLPLRADVLPCPFSVGAGQVRVETFPTHVWTSEIGS